MNNRRLFLLFHGRFPGEKAAAIFVIESARAYARHLPVVVVAPWRLGRTKESLPAQVSVHYMPNIDLFSIPVLGRLAFPLSYVLFSFFSFLYLLTHARKDDLIETNEVLPALLATFLSRNVVYEVHDFPERHLGLYGAALRRVRFVLTTNEWKKNELSKRFKVPTEKILMERNGVDTERFAPADKAAARTELGLPLDEKIVLYTGHLYSWKGVDTLGKAAALMPEANFYFVGGSAPDIATFTSTFGANRNITMVGQRPHSEIPVWLAAADVLVLPNTAKEEISAHYTSPMKLFEYMASERPIVASRLPSIEEILSDDAGYLAEPDSPQAFAASIRDVLGHPSGAAQKASAARREVQLYSWDTRARRILEKLLPAKVG